MTETCPHCSGRFFPADLMIHLEYCALTSTWRRLEGLPIDQPSFDEAIDEYADGKVLIAGTLYDSETLDEIVEFDEAFGL